MSRVQAISGTTGQQELEALREQAVQLGADTAFFCHTGSRRNGEPGSSRIYNE